MVRLATGTDLQSGGVATVIRGVHESTIRRYMRLFEAELALREANDALLHFARNHSIVNHWGTGFEASSDLISLDASSISTMLASIRNAVFTASEYT